jgi:hypothetical protein
MPCSCIRSETSNRRPQEQATARADLQDSCPADGSVVQHFPRQQAGVKADSMTPASLNRGCLDPSMSREDSSESLRRHSFALAGEAMPLPGSEPKFTDRNRPAEQAVWALGNELDKTVKSIEEKRRRETDTGGTGMQYYDDASKVLVIEIQWVEREVFYLIADEQTNQKLKINEKQYQHMLSNAKKLEEKLGNGITVMPTAARLTRKVYKRAFLGSELLQAGDAPIKAPIKGRFSWACITGELDRNKGHWFSQSP